MTYIVASLANCHFQIKENLMKPDVLKKSDNFRKKGELKNTKYNCLNQMLREKK